MVARRSREGVVWEDWLVEGVGYLLDLVDKATRVGHGSMKAVSKAGTSVG